MGVSINRKGNKKDKTNLTPLPVDARCTPIVFACFLCALKFSCARVSCKIQNPRTSIKYPGLHLVVYIHHSQGRETSQLPREHDTGESQIKINYHLTSSQNNSATVPTSEIFTTTS